MARYIQNAHMGDISPGEYKDFRTIFHGASEAPRVHGMLGDTFDRLPRFKNHYFVAFQYTDLTKSSADPKMLIDVMHRIKSIDAPKFDIETETLNQYNKPRQVPTKIVYQPITITFHDDKSNYTTDFWRRIYQFYFLNGQRLSESQYSTRDSDIVIDSSGPAGVHYNNYGYYIDNKVDKKNLFYSMSLYMLQNRMCTRMDLINPQLQSMSHDQFSQEMTNELAQHTTMWGYENVVYYSSQSMDNNQTLRAYNYSVGNPAIFQSSPKNPNPDGKPYRETYADTATGRSTAPEGNKGDFPVTPALAETHPDSYALDMMGEVRSEFDYSGSAQPKYVMATKTPELGFIPKSGLDSEISEVYTRLASGLNEMLNPLEWEAWAVANSADAKETATAVDEFGNLAAIESATEARNTKNSDEQRQAAMDAKVQAAEATKFEAHPKADPFIPGNDFFGDDFVGTSGLPNTGPPGTVDAAQVAATSAQQRAAVMSPAGSGTNTKTKTWDDLSSAEKSARATARLRELSGPQVSTANQNTRTLKYTNPSTGKVHVVASAKNKSGTIAQLADAAVNRYNSLPASQKAAEDLKRKQSNFYGTNKHAGGPDG